MLRRTVARAFGPESDSSGTSADPAAPRDRLEAVGRLFANLHAQLETRIAQTRPAGRPGGPTEVTVDRLRALLQGSEFQLESPRRSLRFLNTLDAIIWVQDRTATKGPANWREMISVGSAADGFPPLRKLLGSWRTGYVHTSVTELADGYLSECLKD